ncbi:MAG: hypothetical protein WC812_03915 [Candidatus Pacearchaeota archaeon]|jgi:hypothetical protein
MKANFKLKVPGPFTIVEWIFIMMIVLAIGTCSRTNAQTSQNFFKINVHVQVVSDEQSETSKKFRTFYQEEFYFNHKFSSNLAFTSFATVRNDRGEIYSGLEYSPKEWITFGLSAGLDVAKEAGSSSATLRTATSVSLKPVEQFEFKGIFEYSSEDYWFLIEPKYNGKKFSLSLIARRYHGVGFSFYWPIAKGNLTLWYYAGYLQGKFLGGDDNPRASSALGLKVNF